MGYRMIGLYAVMIMLFGGLIMRIYYITQSDFLTAAAGSQSSYNLDITTTRGMIYDQNMKPLVDTSYSTMAAIMPCAEAMNAVATGVVGEERGIALERMKSTTPFIMDIGRKNLYSRGINTLDVYSRYDEKQLAPHVIGYTDKSTGEGIRGIELAYNDLLKGYGEEVYISYKVDAFKRPITGVLPEIVGDTTPSKEGVVTTLDEDIQRVVEQVAAGKMEQGAVVVMDCDTGELRAVASMPRFEPNHIADALEKEGSPLFNRAFGAYSVGSTFKLAVASAALKQGVPTDFAFFCPGYIEVNGIHFSCHKKDGHGWLDMERAIEQSCNPYFVSLAQEIDPKNLLYIVNEMGYGKSATLAPGMSTEAGTLYTAAELENKANMSNFSFGQGKLTATPVQVAQMISCIANGGYTVSPSLVKGITTDGVSIAEEEEAYARNKLLTDSEAKTLRDFMINVVENGSGKKGRPTVGGAGGKTASAQTGHYTDGKEKVEAWFAGFYPAENPQYTIVVFVEGGEFGGDVAGPIFKAIADGISGDEEWS